MTAQTEARAVDVLAEEMRAGLEGVTPGPWYQTGAPWFRSGDGVLAGSPDGNIAYIIADCDNFAAPRDEYDGPFPLGDQERDAAHIARCSPENIRALLDDRATLTQENAELRAELSALKKQVEELTKALNRKVDEKCAAVQARTRAEAEAAALRKALIEARAVVDAVTGHNQPDRPWSRQVRDRIDAALASTRETSDAG